MNREHNEITVKQFQTLRRLEQEIPEPRIVGYRRDSRFCPIVERYGHTIGGTRTAASRWLVARRGGLVLLDVPVVSQVTRDNWVSR